MEPVLIAELLLRLVIDIIGMEATKKALTAEEVRAAKLSAEMAELLKFGPASPESGLQGQPK